MRPARFDPVVRARQIVYSYVPTDDGDVYARPDQCTSLCVRTHDNPASVLVPRIITFVQIALIAAIAANLGFIAAR